MLSIISSRQLFSQSQDKNFILGKPGFLRTSRTYPKTFRTFAGPSRWVSQTFPSKSETQLKRAIIYPNSSFILLVQVQIFFFVKLFQSRVKQLKFFSKAYDRRIRYSRLIRHESWKAKLPTLDERIHVILLDNGDVLTTQGISGN